VFPPGEGVPFHMHSREDETFYVVSGMGEFRLGDTTVVRGAGSRVYGPRDVPHTFRNVGDDDLKCLIVYSLEGSNRASSNSGSGRRSGFGVHWPHSGQVWIIARVSRVEASFNSGRPHNQGTAPMPVMAPAAALSLIT